MAVDTVVVRPAPHPYSHPLVDWGAAIAGTLKRVAEMGATDFQATPFGDEEEIARTVELLASRPV